MDLLHIEASYKCWDGFRLYEFMKSIGMVLGFFSALPYPWKFLDAKGTAARVL